jgi:hypothetical protein
MPTVTCRSSLYLPLRYMCGPTVRVFLERVFYSSFCKRVSGSSTRCRMPVLHTLNHSLRWGCVWPIVRCRRLRCSATGRRGLPGQGDQTSDDASLGQCVLHASQRGRVYPTRSYSRSALRSHSNGVLLPQRNRLYC